MGSNHHRTVKAAIGIASRTCVLFLAIIAHGEIDRQC